MFCSHFPVLRQNAVMNATVELTASHKGYFEFHICQSDNKFNKVTEDCLKQHPLRHAVTNKLRIPVPDNGYNQKIHIPLALPAGLACRACVLQWKYNAGNSWGTDKPEDGGKSCVGCGNQEQFYACADIAIGAEGGDWREDVDDVVMTTGKSVTGSVQGRTDRGPQYQTGNEENHAAILSAYRMINVVSLLVFLVTTRAYN